MTVKPKQFFPSQPHGTAGKISPPASRFAVWLVPDPEWGWAGSFVQDSHKVGLGCPTYFPPFRGGKYLDIPLWVGDSRCDNLWSMI